MYELRVHGLRKYSKTQMLALGVQPDYVDYMMSHTLDTYHDIQMKGIEFLRNIYASSGLTIWPKTKVSKVEALKEIIRAWQLNPEKILTREALTQEAATILGFENQDNNQLTILSKALRDIIRQETAGQMRTVDGGPVGNWTRDPRVKSPVLWTPRALSLLSYGPTITVQSKPNLLRNML
jgi:hypothetical protein